MKSNRNSYLVSKALKGFVLASILTSAAGQLASTIDAIVLAQFEGAEAVSALNLVLPVTMLISCLGLLMCFGANALMARFIGHHDLKSAQAIFSTAIWSVLTLGVTFSLLMYAGIPAVLRAIANESGLRELAKEYLGTYVLGAWLEMLSYALCLFVATDGHPRRVTLSVSMGVVVNIVVDVLAVGWFEWGIRGIALGTLAQYAVNVALLGLYLRHPSCSYRLLWPGGGLRRLFVKNVAEGAPMTISNVLMAVTLLLINNIILGTQGERGLFFWTICLQTLLVAMVLVNGVMEALVAIGGVMMGEHDVGGFSLLARKGLATAGGLVALAMVPLWVPDAVGMAFGMEDAGELAALNETLRIFSLTLLPFALTLTLVAVYLVLERTVLGVGVIVGQLATLVVVVWMLGTHAAEEVWCGFPLGALLFLGGQLAYSYASSRRGGCRVSGLTLIPHSEGGEALDCSVAYRLEDVWAALNEIVRFLEETGVEGKKIFDLNVCLEELMTNIAQHSTGRVVHHSFDVHVFVKDGHARVTLKDGGHPFDPIGAGHAEGRDLAGREDAKFGVYLAANIIEDISYKYMYGLNVVLIKT